MNKHDPLTGYDEADKERIKYAVLLQSARDVFAIIGSVWVGYEALGASALSVGLAPKLAADLGTTWRRDDRDAMMIFGA